MRKETSRLMMKKFTHHKSTSQSIALHRHRTTSASQLDQKCRGRHLLLEDSKPDPDIIAKYTGLVDSNNKATKNQRTKNK